MLVLIMAMSQNAWHDRRKAPWLCVFMDESTGMIRVPLACLFQAYELIDLFYTPLSERWQTHLMFSLKSESA